jgi:hypothetical protein
MDMIYISLFIILVSKTLLNYASKLHFTTLFDNLKNLDYPSNL